MKHAVWLPLFDDFADPAAVAELAIAAEAAGWDGLFVWDHVRWRPPDRPVGDAWTSLAAVAMSTRHLRLGAMVTPLPRRRPAVLARQAAAIDRLSGARLTFGAGLGSDHFAGEYSAFGEPAEARTHAEKADECLAILQAAWSGRPVSHHGHHYTVEDVTFLPRPRQATVPIWIAGTGDAPRPRRRAARYGGYIPVNLRDPEQLALARADIASRLTEGTPFDYAATLAYDEPCEPYRQAGATWCLREIDTRPPSTDVTARVAQGPPA